MKIRYDTMKRRHYLAAVASGVSTGLAGCVFENRSFDETNNTSHTNTNNTNQTSNSHEGLVYPDECPVTQDLTVPIPSEFDEETAISFVSEYEEEYTTKSVNVQYKYWDITNEPSTSIEHTTVDNSALIVETQTIWSGSTDVDVEIRAEPRNQTPDSVDPINVEELSEEASPARNIAHDAVDEDRVKRWRDRTQIYNKLTEQIASGQSNTDEYYVTVEDTPVSLTITSHSTDIIDGNIIAWYYIDDVVIRRTEDEDIYPNEGSIVECISD
ncbi:hypothetical protein [Natrarchaeobaculum sulfurireducens]|uniref:hypothetical protein n=1 Tax=Natrarchaeobaculum sulfurireducens TaxID=2044521 RepID=UPI00105AB078|nr:hypothetical protein [Natrarchaeobaculum sulfurireducens]